MATHLHRPSWSNLSSSFSGFGCTPVSPLRRVHRRDEVPSRPEVLTHEVALSLSVHPRKVDCALAFDKSPPPATPSTSRWDRQHHVHVIRASDAPLQPCIPFARPTFVNTSPRCSRSCLLQRSPSTLGMKTTAIFAIPGRGDSNFHTCPSAVSSFRLLGRASPLKVSIRWTIGERN